MIFSTEKLQVRVGLLRLAIDVVDGRMNAARKTGLVRKLGLTGII